MIGIPHILTVTEVERGIQALGASLGVDWHDLIQFNNLVPPYITNDISEVFGPPVASTILPGPVGAGFQAITLPNEPQSTNTIYLSASGMSGLVAEAVAVESYNGTTFQLVTPIKYGYMQGTQVLLFSTFLTTQVLIPGDVLYVPSASGNFTVNGQNQVTDSLGSDFLFPLSFASGDLATVQGVNTLNQRLMSALQTEINSLPLHPDWGSRFMQVVGQNPSQTQWSALIRECLLALPEVTDVQNTNVTQSGSTLYISADVYTDTSSTAIQLQNVPLSIGGLSLPYATKMNQKFGLTLVGEALKM